MSRFDYEVAKGIEKARECVWAVKSDWCRFFPLGQCIGRSNPVSTENRFTLWLGSCSQLCSGFCFFLLDWEVYFHVPRNPVIQIWHGVCFLNTKEPPLLLWIGPKFPARCKTKSRADTGAIPWQSSWVWMVGMTSPHSRCTRGDQCTFAHFAGELRPRSDWVSRSLA
jgi:hypothetical protein